MIYLDNAATTFPKPGCVYEDADKFYRENGAYPGRGNYSLARKVSCLIEETRKLILQLFKADRNYSVVFTSSATIAINIILNGYEFKDGMNVYISPFEHNAVLRTLNEIKGKININVRKLVVNRNNLVCNEEKIGSQFNTHNPDMVIMNHASNVIGLISPVEKIFKMSKRYGAINILDASQTAGILQINIDQISSDFIVFAGHKSLYAPFGISGMVLNKKIRIQPLIFGGTGFNSSDMEMPFDYPSRLESGSVSTYSIAGLNTSLKWIKNVGIENIFLNEEIVYNYAVARLAELKNVKCYVSDNPRIPIISFTVGGYTPDEISKILDFNDIAVRSGLHCSPDCHKFIGTFPSGTVRLSIGYFNTTLDIDKLVNIIEKV